MTHTRLGLALAFGLVAGAAHAAPTDYRFVPVSATVERGVAVTLKVEVRERLQNQLVPNVEIGPAQVDRSPDGRPNEAHPAFFAPSLDYGVYGFRADMPTDGNWALTFTAKIPGEAQLVAASVTFVAVEPRQAAPVRPAPGSGSN
jgi:hypothetical protein